MYPATIKMLIGKDFVYVDSALGFFVCVIITEYVER